LFLGGFYWISTIGEPATAAEAQLLVANHVSSVDPFIFAVLPQMPSFVAKQTLRDMPIVGVFAQVFQCIFVDRMDVGSRKQAQEEIKRKVHSEGRQLLVFPEGTVTNGNALISFRQGAFAAGVPVQPICIRYPHEHFTPARSTNSDQALMWFRLLCQFVNKVEIIYLPVYHPSPEEIADPTLYANNVRNVMARTLHIPTTNHTYLDALERMEKNKNRRPAPYGGDVPSAPAITAS